MSWAGFWKKGKALVSSQSEKNPVFDSLSDFTKTPREDLFPKVDPAVDGEDCDHDCASCSIHLPKGFKIDESEELYGQVNPYETHLLVATGKTDWKHDIENEKGSVMEAVGNSKIEPENGRMMLSASNLPVPTHDSSLPTSQQPTTVLLLPSFTYIDNVTPDAVPDLMKHCVSTSRTNTMPLDPTKVPAKVSQKEQKTESQAKAPEEAAKTYDPSSQPHVAGPPPAELSTFPSRPCSYKYLILMCSHRTRDARCGQSAPLLKREFERHLRPLGLYRDVHDERPGGVGIYFISHVGRHKYSANVLIYRKGDEEGKGEEAGQCIWLSRVRPEDCEGIVKFTVLQGKIVKPGSQLRGGFDRVREVVSW